MKIFQKIVCVIRSYIGHMGAYFLLTVSALSILGSVQGRTFAPADFGIATLFSALLALCDFILAAKFIPSLLAKSAIHAVLATASFVISFVLVAGRLQSSTAFVISVVFFVFVAIVLAVRAAYISAVRRANEKEENQASENK